MIIYPAEHDMTVWIILVEMTDNDVRGIHDAHFLHILLGNLYHNLVINLILVVGMEVQGNMSDRIFQVRIQGEIILKRSDNSISPFYRRYIFMVYKTPFITGRALGIILLSACDIIDATAKTTTF